MINFELTPDGKRYCKTLVYNCLDEESDCASCKCVKFEDGVFSKNYQYFDDNNICDWCGGFKFMVVPKWAVVNLTEDELHFQKYKELRDWIIKTSKCSTCHGEQFRTFGGIPCKECGLIGSAPWGG